MKRRWTSLAGCLLRPRQLAALVAACLLAAGCYLFWGRSRTEDHLRQARQAMGDCAFEEAKAHFNAYLTARPDDAEAHFLLARACRRARIEDFGQAHRHLDDARRLGRPAFDLALESTLLDAQERGVSVEREASLRQYLDSGGVGGELVLEALARGCLAENRVDEAEAWLNQWVGQAPDDWYARLWRGALFEYLGEPNNAIPDFEFVLKKRPEDAEVRKRLGLTYAQSGYNYQKTLRLLESYVRNHPADADALVGVARCRRALGQPDAAEALLRRVLADRPDHWDALETLVLIASDRGDDPEAVTLLRRLEPLTRLNRGADGLARLRRLEPTPNSTDILQRRLMVFTLTAAALTRLGRDEEARRCQAEAGLLTKGHQEIPALVRALQEGPRDVAAAGQARRPVPGSGDGRGSERRPGAGAPGKARRSPSASGPRRASSPSRRAGRAGAMMK